MAKDRGGFVWQVFNGGWYYIFLVGLQFIPVHAKENSVKNESFPLSMAVQVNPNSWPNDKMSDVVFQIRLTNETDKKIRVFPKVAKLKQESGWVGPTWQLILFEAQGKRHSLREIRSWYGPPGHPPNEQYFQRAGLDLKKGQSTEIKIHSCWIPNGLLSEGHLSLESLDPQGLDGFEQLALDVAKANVLVMNRTCDDIAVEMKRRVDFLRPNLVLFLESGGQYDLAFSYAQESNSFIKCETLHSNLSDTVSVRIP